MASIRHNLSGFTPMRFELEPKLEPKAAALNMRLPHNLLQALKLKAQAHEASISITNPVSSFLFSPAQ